MKCLYALMNKEPKKPSKNVQPWNISLSEVPMGNSKRMKNGFPMTLSNLSPFWA